MRKQLRQKTRKNARAHNCGGSQPPNVLPIRSTKLVKANTTAAAPSRPNVLTIRSTMLAKENATAAAPSHRTSFPSAVRS